MICTNTDHYVNTLSTIKKEKKKKIYVQPGRINHIINKASIEPRPLISHLDFLASRQIYLHRRFLPKLSQSNVLFNC